MSGSRFSQSTRSIFSAFFYPKISRGFRHPDLNNTVEKSHQPVNSLKYVIHNLNNYLPPPENTKPEEILVHADTPTKVTHAHLKFPGSWILGRTDFRTPENEDAFFSRGAHYAFPKKHFGLFSHAVIGDILHLQKEGFKPSIDNDYTPPRIK